MQVKDIIKKVKQIELQTKKRTESKLTGQYHSAFKGQGMTFAEVRKYQIGDDIRRIDWNKTARFQDTFIKVMEEERELNIMFIIDISASMNYGTQAQLKKEYIAEICASIGFSAIQNNDKIGGILFADDVYKIIPPQKGKKHLLSIISQILTAEYIHTKTNINEPLDKILNIFKKKSMLFLFSDFNDDMDKKKLSIVAKKHQLIGIQISDEKDYEIPNIGLAEFQDIETGNKTWVDTSNPYVRYHFMEERKQKKEKVKHFFKKIAVRFISLNTKEDYLKPLSSILK